MQKTFVIAEAGISHDGDLIGAMRLVDVAKKAGADAVKFQYFDPERLAKRRGKPELAAKLAPYRMRHASMEVLKDRADKAGIEFMCSTFDIEGLSEIAPLVSRFKIPSPEALDREFVDAHYGYGKPVIISCGENPKRFREPVTSWLWCVSRYPCPLADARLDQIRIGGYNGYSDHTGDTMMGALAVASGAGIVEAHLKGSWTRRENPDYETSLDDVAFKQYVELIREAEKAVYGQASEGSSGR